MATRGPYARIIVYSAISASLLAACTQKNKDRDKAQPTSRFSATAPAALAAMAEPGGDQASAELAQSQPDEYAWKLFEFVCLQAAPGQAGVPAGKSITQYDEDTPIVFETWALASGDGTSQDGSEVFKPDGSDPGEWTRLPRGAARRKVFSANLKLAAARSSSLLKMQAGTNALQSLPVTGPGRPSILIGPGEPARDFEVRLNQAAFTFVQQQGMYNLEGLETKYQQGKASGNRDFIQFAPMAKEIKADWVPTANPTAISADEKARYHWRKVGNTYYKLVGFHITTKDLKSWFWADFAQEDYETTEGPGQPVVADPSIDSTTRGANAPDRGDRDGVRKELMGSKWAHYRLRGVQLDFDRPTVLGNTMIEQGNARNSSCMTCHFRATVGPLVNGRPSSLGSRFVTGRPSPDLLGKGSDIAFLQTDFEFSAPFRAQHKTAR
jgi:hypothetical protein